jgi:transposase
MPAQRKYPEELRERAVKMVLEIRDRDGKGRGELARVGRQLGVHREALRGLGPAGGGRWRDAAGHDE